MRVRTMPGDASGIRRAPARERDAGETRSYFLPRVDEELQSFSHPTRLIGKVTAH
jgi:hypothetical protein